MCSSDLAPPAEEVRELTDYVHRHRESDDPFEIVVGGLSPAGVQARDLIGPLADAGATWWDERQWLDSDDIDKYEPVMRRIEQGPPAL